MLPVKLAKAMLALSFSLYLHWNRSTEEGKLLMSYGLLLMFGGKMALLLAVAHLVLYGYTTLKASIGRLLENDVNSAADVDLQNKNESNTS
ncbi:hypothetical protein ACP275_08G099800 [Erythranthe tilingii]